MTGLSMNDDKSAAFWLGNGILAVALLMLLYMNTLWEMLGGVAMLLWIGVVAVGVYFLMQKGDRP